MTSILTDAEIAAAARQVNPEINFEGFARSIEQAILAKLNSAEPFAYMADNEIGMAEFVDAYYVKMTGGQLPFPNSAEVIPLFTHPPARGE